MADFILNGWYVAGWSRDISTRPTARRMLDMPLMVFRWPDGDPGVLLDRCPHRFAPLSKGTIEEDRVICGYHGLQFDRSGACIASPFNKVIPPASVRVFPTAERFGVVWFWAGEASLADQALIPDLSGIEQQPGPHGYIHVQANYQIVIDNLMDLSHIEFVHLRTFGGAGAFFSGQHSAERVSDREIWSRWWMPNVDAPTPAKPIFGDRKVDHWQDMRWNPPSSLLFDLGVIPAGIVRETAPKRPVQAHLLTPETATTTHYFYSIEPGSSTKDAAALLRIAFEEEDEPMMAAVQANMEGDFWKERPVVLETDRAAIMVRRSIAKMIREEQPGETARPAEPIERSAEPNS